MKYTPLPLPPKHIKELEDMRNKLGQIGDEMLDTSFDQGNFDQIAIAFHALQFVGGN